jgi:uncharacterized membrane-anchored protein YhcB (DUF1043 family)
MKIALQKELERLKINLDATNKEIEKLIDQRAQLIGAIGISNKYVELHKECDCCNKTEEVETK